MAGIVNRAVVGTEAKAVHWGERVALTPGSWLRSPLASSHIL